MDAATPRDIELEGHLYEPWLFLALLDQLSEGEVGLGLITTVLNLLAQRYRLSDAVVILEDHSLGTQAFFLRQKSVRGELLASPPGVYCVPEIVPEIVRDTVRNICQLALTVHLARHHADRDPLTNIANRQNFDELLRIATVQSARYGWGFTLVILDVHGHKAAIDRQGSAYGDTLLRSFGMALRRSVRSGDTVARVDDEQFALILCNADGTDVLAFIERLSTHLSSTVNLDFTFGGAMSPRDSTDPGELIRLARSRLGEKKITALR